MLLKITPETAIVVYEQKIYREHSMQVSGTQHKPSQNNKENYDWKIGVGESYQEYKSSDIDFNMLTNKCKQSYILEGSGKQWFSTENRVKQNVQENGPWPNIKEQETASWNSKINLTQSAFTEYRTDTEILCQKQFKQYVILNASNYVTSTKTAEWVADSVWRSSVNIQA